MEKLAMKAMIESAIGNLSPVHVEAITNAIIDKFGEKYDVIKPHICGEFMDEVCKAIVELINAGNHANLEQMIGKTIYRLVVSMDSSRGHNAPYNYIVKPIALTVEEVRIGRVFRDGSESKCYGPGNISIIARAENGYSVNAFSEVDGKLLSNEYLAGQPILGAWSLDDLHNEAKRLADAVFTTYKYVGSFRIEFPEGSDEKC